MLTFLKGAFGMVTGALGGLWGYVAAGVATLVAILVALARAKQAGREEVITKQAKKEVENVKTAQKVERDIAVAKPDYVRKRLSKYSRD